MRALHHFRAVYARDALCGHVVEPRRPLVLPPFAEVLRRGLGADELAVLDEDILERVVAARPELDRHAAARDAAVASIFTMVLSDDALAANRANSLNCALSKTEMSILFAMMTSPFGFSPVYTFESARLQFRIEIPLCPKGSTLGPLKFRATRPPPLLLHQ